ncbi:MAG: hypothetical protein K2M64_00940, partial [Clostridia bacterium]|nr:hypothetical protein [Clostridia bacterium]
RNAETTIRNFTGSGTLHTEGAPNPNDVLKFCKGKSIIFMSKNKLIDELNANFPEWHAIAVVKSFPNSVNVYFVKREAAIKIDIGGNYVYVDSFGYVVAEPIYNCMDISSAFDYRDVTVNELGKKLQFKDDSNNTKFNIILQAIITNWRCYIDFEDMSSIMGASGVFEFDSTTGDFIINTLQGAKIKVVNPAENLEKRLIAGYSVYYNDTVNLQKEGVLITVELDKIITPNYTKKI